MHFRRCTRASEHTYLLPGVSSAPYGVGRHTNIIHGRSPACDQRIVEGKNEGNNRSKFLGYPSIGESKPIGCQALLSDTHDFSLLKSLI